MPDLSQLHTFGIASQCRSISEFSSVEHLLKLYNSSPLNYVMGEGSNTIFVEDFDGQVLLNNITGVTATKTDKGIHLSVGAGENWHSLVEYTVEQGWGGLENLALIPGSVGAAPIQNIGAYGLEVGERIESVDVVDVTNGNCFKLSQQDCEFGYRHSVFKTVQAKHWVVLKVHFWLPFDVVPITDYAELKALVDPDPLAIFNRVVAVRQQKLPDPKVLGNAGSFFKNPTISTVQYESLKSQYDKLPGYILSAEQVKVPAAWFIDTAGFKGKCQDGVCSYERQPLVLVNQHNAKGTAVVNMARTIRDTVKEKFDVMLEPEVRLIGKEGLIAL